LSIYGFFWTLSRAKGFVKKILFGTKALHWCLPDLVNKKPFCSSHNKTPSWNQHLSVEGFEMEKGCPWSSILVKRRPWFHCSWSYKRHRRSPFARHRCLPTLKAYPPSCALLLRLPDVQPYAPLELHSLGCGPSLLYGVACSHSTILGLVAITPQQ